MKSFVVGLGLLIPSIAWSSGYALHAQGSYVGGMAHTGTTVTDSAEAAWWNPAQCTDGSGLRLVAGGTGALVSMYADALDTAQDGPWSTDTLPGFAVAPHLYGSYAHDDWAIGVTVNLPHVSRIRWPDDGPLRFESIESRPQFLRTTLFSAMKFGAISVALGPTLDVGQVYTRRATDHVLEEGEVQLSLRGFGLGLHAAAAIQLDPAWTLGIRYHSRVQVNTRGEIDFDVPLAFSATLPDQSAEAVWSLPDHVNIGARWTQKTWSMALELGLQFWSIQDELIVTLPKSDPIELTYDWRTSAVVKVGASTQVHPKLTIQMGSYLDGIPAAVPTDTLGPASPDSTRIGVTTGLRWTPHSSFGLSAHYEGIHWLARDATGYDTPQAKYGGQAHMFGLSAAVLIP